MQEGSVKELDNLSGVDPLIKIFLELVSYNTASDEAAATVPSSLGQLRLGAHLCSLASELGYKALQDDAGVVKVEVPPSEGCEHVKSLCLLAHMDTSPDFSGAKVRPSLIRDYQGEGIKLANGLTFDEKFCKNLSNHLHDALIVTDGTTLLGADDKAGISILLYLLRELKVNENLRHGRIVMLFTVDEEIGLSASHIDVSAIDCDYGLSIDGGDLGEVDVKTFNAYMAKVSFKGVSVHTGDAYKKLVNAISLAHEFAAMLPQRELPETTMDEEGFYHIYKIEGSTASCTLHLLIRDFTEEGMQKRLHFLDTIKDYFSKKYFEDCVQIDTRYQYGNLYNVLKEHQGFITLIKNACTDAKVEFMENHVRGGTDGAVLSFLGLPTPNLFTGGFNFHGPYECLSVKGINAAYRVLKNIVSRMATENV